MSSHPLRLTLARDNIEGRLGHVKKSLLDITKHRSQVRKQLRVKRQCLLPCFRLQQMLGWVTLSFHIQSDPAWRGHDCLHSIDGETDWAMERADNSLKVIRPKPGSYLSLKRAILSPPFSSQPWNLVLWTLPGECEGQRKRSPERWWWFTNRSW